MSAPVKASSLIDLRGSIWRPWSELTVPEKIDRVATEVRSIATEVGSMYRDPVCREHYRIRWPDALDLQLFADWAEWARDDWHWRQNGTNARAVRLQDVYSGKGSDVPDDVVDRVKTRPVQPADPIPRRMPPDAPPLPTRDAFVAWDEWCSDFIRRRLMAIAEGHER